MSTIFILKRQVVLCFVLLKVTLLPIGSCAQVGTPVYGKINDIEGNSYKTVVIGKQEWMAENLRTVLYKDGSPILFLAQDNEWLNARKGAWCYYDDLSSYDSLYGKLYNAFAVVDPRGLCPTGWRVPVKKDWDELQSFLGRNWVACKLKSANRVHWQGPPLGNSWTRGDPAPVRMYANAGPPNNNATGLTILAGGFREPLGDYRKMCSEGTYWSSPLPTSVSPTYYPAVTFRSSFGGISDREIGPNTGASIRCIRE